MPLGDHLRANQHVERAFIERVERVLEIVPSADRVAVEPSDARLRKHPVQ